MAFKWWRKERGIWGQDNSSLPQYSPFFISSAISHTFPRASALNPWASGFLNELTVFFIPWKHRQSLGCLRVLRGNVCRVYKIFRYTLVFILAQHNLTQLCFYLFHGFCSPLFINPYLASMGFLGNITTMHQLVPIGNCLQMIHNGRVLTKHFKIAVCNIQ